MGCCCERKTKEKPYNKNQTEKELDFQPSTNNLYGEYNIIDINEQEGLVET